LPLSFKFEPDIELGMKKDFPKLGRVSVWCLEDNIKMNFQKVGCGVMDWIDLA